MATMSHFCAIFGRFVTGESGTAALGSHVKPLVAGMRSVRKRNDVIMPNLLLNLRGARHALRLSAAMLLLGGLVACGGGGGGGGQPPAPTNNAPNTNAGADQTVARNVAVTLAGTATDDAGTAALTFTWSQTAGTAVTLAGSDSTTATFTSPDVAADETLTFDLTATDAQGESDTDSVAVTVLRNIAPTVDAGQTQIVEQGDTVTLTAAATDDDPIANLNYAWVQTGGSAVGLNDPMTATPSFVAPPTMGTQTLSFQVTVTDAFGEMAMDTVGVEVFEDLNSASITGKAEFDFVPFVAGRLNYPLTEQRPIRGATIQLIDAGNNAVLGTTTSDGNGDFTFATTVGRSVFLRVRAELKQAGAPGWDVEVRDNTASTNLPLAERPLYVLDGAAFTTTAGLQNVTIRAESGWTGTSYGNTRAAAPFSVLDTIYAAVQMVVSADPDVVFAPLDAFWSVNNTPTVGGNRDFDTGEIGTSFYRGDLDSLFLLGDENTDTEEYDTHVVAHEWGHFFEDTLSRSDSTGGSHSLTQRLDPRLAFGEGWGNAVSAMINPSPVYFDSSGNQQAGGFTFSLEDNAPNASERGWYNERSVQAILYDLFDSADDNEDTISLGFAPLYEVLVDEQANGEAFTTIHAFITALRARNPALQSQIDALLAVQRIRGDTDAFGTGEIEAAGRPSLTLPIYTEIVPNGGPTEICSSNIYDPDEDGNKLAVRQFGRFTIAAQGNYNVAVVTNNAPVGVQTDPDAFVFSAAFVGGGNSGVADREDFTLSNLAPGTYVLEVYEWSYLAGGSPAIAQNNTNRETCFDITITN